MPLAALAGLGSIDGGAASPGRDGPFLHARCHDGPGASGLFGLDVDMANALWIFSTLALVVILPVLYFVLPLL